MTTNGKSEFFTRFAAELARIKKERGKVAGFDLGCGEGKQAEQMADDRIGAQVVGVDKRLSPWKTRQTAGNPGWLCRDAAEWALALQEEAFDFVFTRNLLHFLEDYQVYQQVLPSIREGIRAGGVVGIAAFYRWPQPDIRAKLISFHGLDRLTAAFPGWETVYSADAPRNGPALHQPGTFRWFSSRLILRKPN